MIQYSQYYTDSIFSELLIDEIKVQNPNIVLDLGIGEGSLTQAALKKWTKASFIAIDIDKKNCTKIQKEQPHIQALNIDALSHKLSEIIKINLGSVDVAICNPPYKKINNSKRLCTLFNKAGLPQCKKLKTISTDIIFLANNLAMLKNNGYLGIIIPDGIATRKDLQVLRDDIIKNHTIQHIIQLPDKIFAKTEARTHILILTKGNYNKRDVKISVANYDGICIDSIVVRKELLIERMDFSYIKWIHSHGIIRQNTNIPISIYRGSLSYKEIKDMELPCFHTTHYKESDGNFPYNQYKIGWRVAEKGDILLARVGKRCVGNVLRVQSGKVLFSDCIYKIRVSEDKQEYLFEYLISNEFKEWVKVFSHGVCSLVISKSDLVNHLQNILSCKFES